MNDQIEARNKSASFYVYGDLCEIQNYSNVRANYIKELDLIYFEGDYQNEHDFILPLDECDSELNIIQLVYNVILNINLMKENEIKIKK
jgi:hypothetical protein